MHESALLAALGAAVLFAASSSLQHHETGSAPAGLDGALGLLRHLLTRRRWLAGQLCATVAFCLHALALHLGPLLLVQPVVVSGIVLAVPLRAALARHRPPTSEVVAVLVTALGVAVLIIAAGDTVGDRTPGDAAALGTVLGGVAVAATAYALAGRGTTAARRAGAYGAVAGLLFGVVAALVKTALDRLDGGFDGVLDAWPLLAVAVLGLCGVATNQRSYRVGSLSASMPVLNAVNVVVALALGVALFGEVPAHSPAALVLMAAAVLCVVLGVAWSSAHAELARSEDVGLSSTASGPDPGWPEQRLATPSQPVGG